MYSSHSESELESDKALSTDDETEGGSAFVTDTEGSLGKVSHDKSGRGL